MSDAQKKLVDAIRRIAKSDPEVRGALDFLRKRGALPEVSVTAVPEEDTSCCDSPGEFGPDPANPDGGGGGRNPDGSWSPPGSDPDTEWNDCETGAAIQFTPAGFVQPETCKECEPDETWEEGTYWQASQFTGDPIYRDGGAVKPCQDMWAYRQSQILSLDQAVIYDVVYRNSLNSNRTQYVYLDYKYTYFNGAATIGGTGQISAVKSACGASTADYCQLTEAPEICGENWQSDSTTNYTLANGCITGSSCDPDATEQAKQCNECINMCDSVGNQWTVCGTGDGGFVAYDPSGEKDGVKYNGNGQQQSVIPAGSGAGGFI